MKGKTVGLMLCSVVLFSVGTGASANGGVISFKGQMVTTGCEVRPQPAGQSFEGTQQVQVSAHLTLAVGTDRNACSDPLIPFTATYTTLTTEQTPGITQGAGVVTLTYQ
jgi:type 1 fimbria pilin